MCRWYVHLYKGRRWYTKLFSAFMTFVVCTLVFFGMVDINFLGLFGPSPGFNDILNPPSLVASEIYGADGQLIGKFYNENRSPVEYEDVNPVFWDALVDTEDERFYSHHGVDIRGVFGAFKDAITLRGARGGSTITQQLAKNMFRVRADGNNGLLGKIPGVRMLVIKSKEWIIATKLEMVYDKQEILTMYANTVDFGSNAYGIKTACKTYFNTTPKELTTDQAATLVGMLKATSYYNPILNPENSRQRRNVVLRLMRDHGHLSESDYQSLISQPTKITYTSESSENTNYSYFKDAVEASLERWCHQTGYDLYTSGLKIYTTINPVIQKSAEEAVRNEMVKLQEEFNKNWGGRDPWRDEYGNVIPHFVEGVAKKLPLYQQLSDKYDGNQDSINYYLNQRHKVTLFDYNKGTFETEMSTLDSIRYMVRYLHTGFVAMEPQTGAVVAWVGDVDYGTWKYDKVTAMRQPGSTFKLFVYTEAFNQGLLLCDKRRDEYIEIPIYDNKTGSETIWKPTNSNNVFSGDSMTLRQAFASSTNSVAVRLGMEMGVKNVIKTAHDMGVKSNLDPYPTTLLGASDVNLFEMVNAYSTIANNGKCHEPVLVSRIEDSDGNIIYEGPIDSPRTIPYKTAYMMQQLLLNGVANGTSRRMHNYVGDMMNQMDIGGKTGTSNECSDGWFVCVTPNLVFGAWVGGEYRSIHFSSTALGQGARTALPICGTFLQKVLANRDNWKKYVKKFEIPTGETINISQLDCSPKPLPYHKPVQPDSLDAIIYEDEYDDNYPPPTDEPPSYDNPPQEVEPIIEI